MRIPFLLLIMIAFAGEVFSQRTHLNPVKRSLFHSRSPVVQRVIAAPDTFHVQIIFEKIRRDKKGRPHFRRFTWMADPDLYFYPASTIKMANAVVALEKLHDMGLSPDLTFHTGASRYPQEAITLDSTAKDLRPTLSHYIDMVFVVSDNAASNRLYEFVGQAELHHRLKSHGYMDTRITHRLGDGRFGPEENRYTNPVYLIDGRDTLYHQPERVAPPLSPLTLEKVRRGKGYINASDSLVHAPFDFSQKNFFPLHDQVDMLKAILFPDAVPKHRRFDLDADDYQFLRQSMSRLPRESLYPRFDTTAYPDGYCKFFIYGDTDDRIPDHIRIYGKVGWAYGFLTETAYIVDSQHQVEFILSATIEANLDGIFNDDRYNTNDIGIPFLAEVGRLMYAQARK